MADQQKYLEISSLISQELIPKIKELITERKDPNIQFLVEQSYSFPLEQKDEFEQKLTISAMEYPQSRELIFDLFYSAVLVSALNAPLTYTLAEACTGIILGLKQKPNFDISSAASSLESKIMTEIQKSQTVEQIVAWLNLLNAMEQRLNYDITASKQLAEIVLTDIQWGKISYDDPKLVVENLTDSIKLEGFGYDMSVLKKILSDNALEILEKNVEEGKDNDEVTRINMKPLLGALRGGNLSEHQQERLKIYTEKFGGFDNLVVPDVKVDIDIIPPRPLSPVDEEINRSSAIQYDERDPIYTYQTSGRYSVAVFRGSILRSKGRLNVAIKRYSSTQRENIEKFNEEGEMLKKLSGLNVKCFLKYYGHFIEKIEEKYMLFIVMEFCERDLMQEITKRKEEERPFTEEELRDNIYELLNGFSSLEQIKIVHRDIKPHNIFIGQDGMKIGDFNIAKSQTEVTTRTVSERMLQGTQGYFSPEIEESIRTKVKAKIHPWKSDVYSLGLTFLQMITFKSVSTYNARGSAEALAEELDKLQYEWLKVMLQNMLRADYRERRSFKKLMAFVPADRTMLDD
ncbi:unnamed protein product [Blepharisma stoltei]|uniref:Protein kinase domain-containing protein n=1 Tax=Blepharisma stoltei TaxID=1481888 RepID=A0AAU9JYH2_9CILI|nr:unnamed protein product [Blepharisma stoltei]